MPEMFSEIDLNQQQRLKCAFDAQGLLNPGKVFPPTLHRCAELGRVHVHGGKLAFHETSEVLGEPTGRKGSPGVKSPSTRLLRLAVHLGNRASPATATRIARVRRLESSGSA